MTTANADNHDPRMAKIRAAFAYTFTKFVEWPNDAFEDPHSPFVVCVSAEDVYAAARRSLEGKTVRDRTISVRTLQPQGSLKPCHVALVSEQSSSIESKRVAHEHHVLTIGDNKYFAENGGMVAAYFVDNKLRFSINLTSARAAELTISSRALALAENIIQE